MKELAVMEWNINQRGGYRGGQIPLWVMDEMKNSDIFILTEFPTKNRTSFLQGLKGQGYHYAVSENSGGNDVLVAVKSCYPILSHGYEPSYDKDLIPENLWVDIDCDGMVFTVVGVRIKTLESFALRKKQFYWLTEMISRIEHPVVVAGDFNNNRRGVERRFDQDKVCREKRWSITQIDRLMPEGFVRFTPNGGSICEEDKATDFEFAEDHFIVKGLTCEKLFDYDRDFVMHDSIVYRYGKDLKNISVGFPDHAILKAEFVLG